MNVLDRLGLFLPVVVLLSLALAATGPFVVIVLVRHSRWKRRERERMGREMEERGRPHGTLKRARGPQGRLKHIEPNTMPLGLRKLVRTGSPYDKG